MDRGLTSVPGWWDDRLFVNQDCVDWVGHREEANDASFGPEGK
jgi:hypothetical protein